MPGEGLFKEDAEKLASQIEDENPMVDILDIKVDPEAGAYVIVAYDRGVDEEFIIDRFEAWASKMASLKGQPRNQLVVKVKEKRGRKTAVAWGKWVEVPERDRPRDICDSLDQGELPGEPLVDIEPSAAEADLVEPGHGSPADYGFDGTFLVLLAESGSKVWRRIVKLANFTLTDRSDVVGEWRSLGFDMSPQPRAPMVEPGVPEWGEEEILEEVRDRLLDISEEGYSAVVVDDQTSVAAYAWVLAGKMGLKVLTSWTAEARTSRAGFSGLGYSELIHYRDVEESL